MATRWIAVALGASSAIGGAILLLVEPGMGFRSFADFWNPDLVVPALTSTAWLVSDLCHLMGGVLLLALATMVGSADPTWRPVPILGVAAGTTFVLLAMIDRAAALLPALLDDPDVLATLAIGFIATRVGVLFAGLFLLGGFVIAVAVSARRRLPRWFVALSLLVGIQGVVFTFVPSPIPVTLAIWAFGLAWIWPSGQAPPDPQRHGSRP